MTPSLSNRVRTVAAFVVTAIYVFVLIGFYARKPLPTGLLGLYSAKYLFFLFGLTVLTPYVFSITKFVLTSKDYTLPSGRMFTINPWSNLKAIVVILVVLVVISESYYAISIAPKRVPSMQSYHPSLLVQPVPAGDRLHLNRWGFRGEDIERVKPAGTYRIFVLGGSTVLCDRVSFEESHVRILEKGLRSRYPDLKIEVQNAGMHWHSTQESLIKYATKIRDFDPDLVIVWHAINDMYRSLRGNGMTSGDYQPDYSNFIGPVRRMIDAYLSSTGTQFRLGFMSEILNKIDSIWFSWVRSTKSSVPLETFAIEEWKSLPAFRRNLDALVTLVKAQGVSIAMASQAHLYRNDLDDREIARLVLRNAIMKVGRQVPDLPSLVRGMSLYNETSRKVAARHSIPFLDLATRVPKDLSYFLDDVHYTEAGNRAVGKAMIEFVIANKFIEVLTKSRSR